MKLNRLTRQGLLAAFVFAGVTANAGNVLVNGDFQTGSLSPWTPFTTANGTNGTGLPDVVPFDTTGTGASLAAHFDVGEVNFTGLQEGGGIEQTFTLSSSGTYNFFANIASQDDADGQINADAGTYSIIIDGTTLQSDSLGRFNSAFQIIRGTLSGSVNLAAGGHTFEVLITRGFLSNGPSTPDEYVDNISLSGMTTGVPEPATYGLIGIALAGLALYRRRRTA